jgi:hypothetical protein
VGKYSNSDRPDTATLRARVLVQADEVPQCATCDFSAYTNWIGRGEPERLWSHLEVAHVVPRTSGGSDDAANLVVLCTDCHADAPNTTSRQIFQDWLERRRASKQGPGQLLYRVLSEVMQAPEYEELQQVARGVSRSEWSATIRTAARAATDSLLPAVHWGQAGWNFETERAVAMEAVRLAVGALKAARPT